jgi:hypothetical protein
MMVAKKKKKKKSSKKKKKRKSSKAKKGPPMTPEKAEAKRKGLREYVAKDIEAGQRLTAADALEEGGRKVRDPLMFVEAAGLRIDQADEDREPKQAETGIDSLRIALDLLYFYKAVAAGEVESDWISVTDAEREEGITKANSEIERAQKVIEDIEEERRKAELARKKKLEQQRLAAAAAAAETERNSKKNRKAKPGVAMIATGSAFTGLGIAGAGMAIAGLLISRSKQTEVEKLSLPADQAKVDQLDREGGRANGIGYAGVGLAAAGILVGVPLLIVGVKRRKEAGPSQMSLRASPVFAGSFNGVTVEGRF